ncbi:unnamed protein product [Ectocarpus sp. 13 AM-2016]
MKVEEGEAGSSKLTFAAKGSYLIWRAPVRPMQMDSRLKVSLGHGDLQGLGSQDDSTYLTMRCGGSSADEARMVIVQVADKEMRNDLVSSVRRLLTQAKVGAMAAQMRGPDAGGSGGGGGGGRPGINRRVSSVFELGGGSGGGRANPGISSPPRRQSTRPSLSTAASFSVGSGGGPGFSPRIPSSGGGGKSPAKAGSGVASATPPLHRKNQNQAEDPEMLDLLKNQLEQLAMAKEAELNAKEVELQESRLTSERTMVQMMELTNEVNTKQDEIRMLKRQAMEAVEDMEEMRRTHKDNAHVSMQLLKKMEGLQFDNEELRHETEFLRNKVAMFYNEARMREDEGGHGGGEGFSREEMPPPSSVSSRDGGGPGMPASPSGSMSSFASCDATS